MAVALSVCVSLSLSLSVSLFWRVGGNKRKGRIERGGGEVVIVYFAITKQNKINTI